MSENVARLNKFKNKGKDANVSFTRNNFLSAYSYAATDVWLGFIFK